MEQNKSAIINSGLSNIKWTALSAVLPQIFNPFITVWLAAILNPTAYGIIALASVVIGFTNLLQGLGFSDYIIKEKLEDDKTLNVAFWANIAIGFFIYAIIYIAGPIYSNFYNSPELTKVIPALGLIIIFNSFGAVQQGILTKRMLFKKLSIIQFAPLVVNIVITLPLAYWGFGVWALVLGSLANVFISNLLYWIFSTWRPRLYFSFSIFKKMFGFGKWIIFQRAIEYAYANYDIFLVGVYYDLKIVGIYSVAKNLLRIVYTTLNGPIGAIMYPMFGLLQSSKEEFKEQFLSITKKIASFNIPIMFGIALLSNFAIPIILPLKWQDLSLLLPILVLGEGIQRNFGVQREIFKVLNKPDVYPKSILLNLCFGIIFYSFIGSIGVVWFCIVRSLNDYLYSSIQIALTSKFLSLKINRILHNLLTPFYSSAIMAVNLLIPLFILNRFELKIDFFILALLILYGSMTYLLSYYLIDKKEFMAIIKIANNVFSIKYPRLKPSVKDDIQ